MDPPVDLVQRPTRPATPCRMEEESGMEGLRRKGPGVNNGEGARPAASRRWERSSGAAPLAAEDSSEVPRVRGRTWSSDAGLGWGDVGWGRR